MEMVPGSAGYHCDSGFTTSVLDSWTLLQIVPPHARNEYIFPGICSSVCGPEAAQAGIGACKKKVNDSLHFERRWEGSWVNCSFVERMDTQRTYFLASEFIPQRASRKRIDVSGWIWRFA